MGLAPQTVGQGDSPWERLRRAEKAAKELKEQKDGAYSERNKLVAALSKLFPASLERHPDADESWEDDWRWIVFIELPTGQASWHIHDSELPLFDHLPQKAGRVWDGHTTEEKYKRLSELDLLFTCTCKKHVVELRNVSECCAKET